ncbi:beta-1,6-N-acetylglucosaminyltransferase [Formosa sp. A9]|uniref:beta-1,6-N-acetylglucosaminyltransferase n=1 Tax=Formosa sp. A9 TaxID=3442641 RepID=UPI003EBF8DEC
MSIKRSSCFDSYHWGGQWWCLTYSTLQKIYSYYLEHRKELDAYYKHTFCADEQFFQTILNVVSKDDASIKIEPNLHFTDWSRKNEPLPVTFKAEDLNLLLNQPENKLFARKFDFDVDVDIMNLLDQNLTVKGS